MAEQERGIQRETRNGAAPPAFGAGGGAAAEMAGTVQILWGALMEQFEVVGMTVAEAHQVLAGHFQVPEAVTVTLNGEPADGNARLRDGDTLEFVRPAGEKGAVRVGTGRGC